MPALRQLVRSARANVALAGLSIGTLAACAPDALRSPTAPADGPSFSIVPITAGSGGLGAPTSLAFATYDGSNEVVHPDVVRAPEAWGGQLLGVLTPYPNSQSQFENPSIFTSTAGEAWTTPAGVTNPLASTTRGYLSDPDLVYDPSRGEMRMYFREVAMSGKRHMADAVYYMTSTDGVAWSTQSLAVIDRGHYMVSPSVVRDGADAWRMWSIDAGTQGCDSKATNVMMRRSSDGKKWNAPSAVRLSQPGYLPWHLDVTWVPERREYWALVAAFPRGAACTSTSLFLATSADGESWTTYPAPVLARGAIDQFSTNVYRSSLLYDADGTVSIWMSGARTLSPGKKGVKPTLKWSAAVARTTAAALLARVNGPAPVLAQRSAPSLVMNVGNDVP